MQHPWTRNSRMRYKTPPPTLLVFYENELVAELQKAKKGYLFKYLQAFWDRNLSTLPGISVGSGEDYSEFNELPSFFRERFPDMRRPEIQHWLKRNPDVDCNDDLQRLGTLGAHSIVDSFELRRPSAA
ncbi:MAG: HipA N-terminal domain-containing protein [Alloacidobacterium sp.]